MNKAEFLNLNVSHITPEIIQAVRPDMSDRALKSSCTRLCRSLRYQTEERKDGFEGKYAIRKIGELVFCKESVLDRTPGLGNKNLEVLKDILTLHETKIGEALTPEQQQSSGIMLFDQRLLALDQYIAELNCSSPTQNIQTVSVASIEDDNVSFNLSITAMRAATGSDIDKEGLKRVTSNPAFKRAVGAILEAMIGVLKSEPEDPSV